MKHRIGIFFFAAIPILLFNPIMAPCNTDTWEFTCPDGGTVTAMCQDAAGVIYAGLGKKNSPYDGVEQPFRGVFRSKDGGANWEHSGLDGYRMEVLAADAVVPGWIYASACTRDGSSLVGLNLLSSDGGDSWMERPGSAFTLIAPDPEVSMRVLASTYGTVLSLSTDGGFNWTDTDASSPWSLCYARSNPEIVYKMNVWVEKSTDRGLTWEYMGGGTEWSQTSAITVSHTNPELVFINCAGVDLFGKTFRNVRRSTDGGLSWVTRSQDFGGFPFLSDPDNDSILYAPFGYSTNGGRRWHEYSASWAPSGGQYPLAIMMDDQDHDHLFVSLSASGVAHSTDRGLTWEFRNKGIKAAPVTDAALSCENPPMIHVIGSDYHRSNDGGASWIHSSDGPAPGNYHSLALNPFDSNNMFRGGRSNEIDSERSTDGGNTWLVNYLESEYVEEAVAFAFNLDGGLYSTHRSVYSSPTLMYSTDGGESWQSRSRPGTSANYLFGLIADPSEPDVAYLCGVQELDMSSGAGVRKSTDAGVSWFRADDGLPDEWGTLPCSQFAFDPVDPQTIYLGAAEGIYRTMDGAGYWEKISYDLDMVTALAVSPFDRNKLVAAGRSTWDYTRSVFLSTDGGANWDKLGSNLPSLDLHVSDISLWSYPWVDFDPCDPEKVWAAVSGYGLCSIRTGPPNRLVTGPGPNEDNPPLVHVFPPGQDARIVHEFGAYGAESYGVNVACGEMDGDGPAEIITGAGPGEIYGPHVRGFEIDGTPLPGLSFMAYGTLKYGVNVTAGDIDADGFDEIITGAGPGAVFGPHVRAFDYDGTPGVTSVPGVSYFAYGTLKYGVNVAAGNIDGDSYDEIVTGAGPGAVFGPHVRCWNVDGGVAEVIPGAGFLAYGTNKFGVNVTCGDLDGDGIDELVTGAGPGGMFGPHVRGWNYDGSMVTSIAGINFFAWPSGEQSYGAKVHASTDLDLDGRDDLVVGAGPDPTVSTPVKVYRYDGEVLTEWFSLEAYDGLTHGVNVAAGRF